MKPKNVYLAVFICALGYFVDVFDLVMFSVVRTASLKDLGLNSDQILSVGVQMINAQMVGMMLGGLFWGILGDKIGRIQALFGSILLYSLGNIANAFVYSAEAYYWCRFVTGFGLAGEIGGAVTLVSEILSKRRGLGTMLVAAAGTFGAVVASYAGKLIDWRICYFIGGVMGLALLALRVTISESGMFTVTKSQAFIKRGSFLMIVTSYSRLIRFFACALIGVGFMVSWTVFATFSPEISLALGLPKADVAKIISLFAIGVTLGDIASGLVSQILKSRKNALFIFALLQLVCVVGTFYFNFGNIQVFEWWFFPMGFFGGLWAVLITTCAEQFGINLRATAATSLPNIVRGVTPIATGLLLYLKPDYGIVTTLQVLAVGAFFCTFIGIFAIKETFGIDLEFLEAEDGKIEKLSAVN